MSNVIENLATDELEDAFILPRDERTMHFSKGTLTEARGKQLDMEEDRARNAIVERTAEK